MDNNKTQKKRTTINLVTWFLLFLSVVSAVMTSFSFFAKLKYSDNKQSA